MTIHDLLASARGRLRRLPADEVPTALGRGAFLVDIRPAAQRAEEGEVINALVIERNVLEWRLDPESDARIPQAGNHDVEWVILCQEGTPPALPPPRCRTSVSTVPPTSSADTRPSRTRAS